MNIKRKSVKMLRLKLVLMIIYIMFKSGEKTIYIAFLCLSVIKEQMEIGKQGWGQGTLCIRESYIGHTPLTLLYIYFTLEHQELNKINSTTI